MDIHVSATASTCRTGNISGPTAKGDANAMILFHRLRHLTANIGLFRATSVCLNYVKTCQFLSGRGRLVR